MMAREGTKKMRWMIEKERGEEAGRTYLDVATDHGGFGAGVFGRFVGRHVGLCLKFQGPFDKAVRSLV